MPKHIGLFGGSFDPPHLGHQALVEEALEQLSLDEVWIIPTGCPVHRNLSGQATAKQRTDWLQTMFESDSRVKIVDWEVNLDKSSPTIATLKRFQAEKPLNIPTWLMGLDSYLSLPTWVNYPAHQHYCNLAVFNRQGTNKAINSSGWKEILLQNWMQNPPQTAGHIVSLDVELPDISATQIRQHPHQHQSNLHQDTCNAISACYASDLTSIKRDNP
ncbi:MAG: nicotinate (nicotinamide) nucleotide adenylyltransferase [Ghiorsea sp.]